MGHFLQGRVGCRKGIPGAATVCQGRENTIRWAEIKAEWHKAACTCTQRERKTEERTEAEIERKMYTIIQFNTTS